MIIHRVISLIVNESGLLPIAEFLANALLYSASFRSGYSLISRFGM